MCTIVARWARGEPVRLLALRDEFTSRAFDDPGRWWPDLPAAVGGRDRLAGGTWCATDTASGTTALVLNRPQKPVADQGAPSRGVLPLRGVRHLSAWPDHVALDGMASFSLVLATPDLLASWEFDGSDLRRTDHQAGTWMFTSGGPETGKVDRYIGAFADAAFPDGWRALVEQAAPADDPAALVVRHERDGLVFATVFGQLVEASPGRLALEYSRRPWSADAWTRFAG